MKGDEVEEEMGEETSYLDPMRRRSGRRRRGGGGQLEGDPGQEPAGGTGDGQVVHGQHAADSSGGCPATLTATGSHQRLRMGAATHPPADEKRPSRQRWAS